MKFLIIASASLRNTTDARADIGDSALMKAAVTRLAGQRSDVEVEEVTEVGIQ